MDIAKEIAVALITSSVVSGIVVWFVKQYLEKRLKYEFKKRESILGSRVEHADTVETSLINAQMGIYPEIMELVYRLSVIIREGVKQPGAGQWPGELRPLCAQLTDNLFKYRLFLDQDLFKVLHEFKHIAQDAALLVDTYTRPDLAFDAKSYAQAVQSFRERQQTTDSLVDQIHTMIHAKLEAIRRIE